MCTLTLHYLNGTNETVNDDLSFSEACTLGSWYKTHCEDNMPTTVVNFTVKPAPKH